MSISALSAIDKVAFTIGSLEVRWYGIIIVFAMLCGLLYLCLECKRINLNTDDAVELFLWLIPLAIIFARVFYVIPRADEYFPWNSWDDFVRTIAIWDGGITIIGGIFGGIIGGAIFAARKRKKCNFGNVADLVIVPLLLGQIIGRLGNFVNQEAFGLPITDARFQFFPFGVYIDDPSGVSSEFYDVVYSNVPGWFCATFFYEMVWNAIGLGICYSVWRKNKKYPGILLVFYLFWYFLGRLWLEFLRVDSVPITAIACAIVVPVALVIGAVYILIRNSQLSFRAIKKYCADDTLAQASLTSFDISNYKFVCKVIANPKNPLKVLYGKNENFSPIDLDSEEFYRVPKGYKRRFAAIMRVEVYSAKEV